jgi:hypothetical protein
VCNVPKVTSLGRGVRLVAGLVGKAGSSSRDVEKLSVLRTVAVTASANLHQPLKRSETCGMCGVCVCVRRTRCDDLVGRHRAP